MPRNSFIRMTKLSNVCGRVNYITSRAKQENLYSVYETADRGFWAKLAKCSQEEFRKSGTEGKCIEARELIIALPESFVSYNPNRLLQVFTDHFKEQYGTDCIAALHHNKRKTNYHIHLIFSERTLLDRPVEKTAARNMFYDEQGNHVRTRKEILDGSGNVRKNCRIVKKGEVYERQIFSVKNARFKSDAFLDEVKKDYTELINRSVRDEKQKLQVFERGGMYLATKKIGKNNPMEDEIRADNGKRMRWNQTVDRALVTGVTEPEILQIKKKQITDRVSVSASLFGNRPDKFSSVIGAAIAILELSISKLFLKSLEPADEVQYHEPDDTDNDKDKTTMLLDAETGAVQPEQPEQSEQPKQPVPQIIPPRPKRSLEAESYHRLCEIKQKLQGQNRAIFEEERQRTEMEIELSDCKGIFKAKRRSELSKGIETLDGRIASMKAYLSNIAREHGFPNVEAFYKAFYKAESAYVAYQRDLKEWERQYGENAQPPREKIKPSEPEIKEVAKYPSRRLSR